MSKVITIVASALLLAYLITELSVRFFPGDYFALLLLAVSALLVNGFFVAIQSRSSARADQSAASETPRSERNNRNARGEDRNARGENHNARGENRGDRGERGSRRNNNDRGNKNERGNRPRSGERDNRGGEGRERPPRREQSDNQPAPVPEGKPVTGETEQGSVKWFNRSKGYGFIVRPNGEEIFVHQRSILSGGNRPVLRDGQAVEFMVTANERGEQAEQVKPLD